MNLFFLPPELQRALLNVNLNFLNEIRLRCGQAVIIRYRGEYKYINEFGLIDKPDRAITCTDAERVLISAMEGSVYAYSEQIKRGFITVGQGIRIGIAGEYVQTDGSVTAIKNVTSLNIRIPHDCEYCAQEIFDVLLKEGLCNLLIFSPPGYGKTTALRSLARLIGKYYLINTLVFDERNEISATQESNLGYNLGGCCDVVRGADKLAAFANAIRAMAPDLIITDELYGERDFNAVKYAADCQIKVIASSHTTDEDALKGLPFDYFVELTGIGKQAVIYDKAFNIIRYCNTFGGVGNSDI